MYVDEPSGETEALVGVPGWWHAVHSVTQHHVRGKCSLSASGESVSLTARTRNPEHNSFAEFWVLLAQR